MYDNINALDVWNVAKFFRQFDLLTENIITAVFLDTLNFKTRFDYNRLAPQAVRDLENWFEELKVKVRMFPEIEDLEQISVFIGIITNNDCETLREIAAEIYPNTEAKLAELETVQELRRKALIAKMESVEPKAKKLISLAQEF